MPATFDLTIKTDTSSLTAEFDLRDGAGNQLAYHATDFHKISAGRLQGLFDLRDYMRHYVDPGERAQSRVLAEIGVSIANDVLGTELFGKLAASKSQRTLRIQLPGATQEQNHLAAALARVPWEIARPTLKELSLAERNLLVRVVHDMATPPTVPMEQNGEDCLKVLFVFAESRGSRPLAARLERLKLIELLETEIYPKRRVVADFLTHGVTRARLEDLVADRSGYHIVHWSGHGHLNLLELAKPGGGVDHLSGVELIDCFAGPGLGYVPRLFFLSACHSGDILSVADWNEFVALAEGKEQHKKATTHGDSEEVPLNKRPGYTGTAHALLEGGVPTVVAMRYSVGDEYARDLAIEFYRALLAHSEPKTASAALTMARQALRDTTKHDASRYDVCDHATPILYGSEDPGLALKDGQSSALDTRNPRLHKIAELQIAEHKHFVGRTWELDGLGMEFIGAKAGADVTPVATITGLGGMGKTALTAEVLELWESRFQWVLLYQAKPARLEFDATLLDIHNKLNGELKRYHQHVKLHPADAIYRSPAADFIGAARNERLVDNLVRAMHDEPILLVLDNLETNLKEQPVPGSGADPTWACQDSAWEYCLKALAKELTGTRSRLLVTSRRPVAALAGSASHHVLLGPLRSAEAALYLREHEGLSQMVFHGDAAEKKLAIRLLEASRFHPLLMDRLSRLATGGPSLRPQLLKALEILEKHRDHAQLSSLFGTGTADPKESKYLDDALKDSLDQLIASASPDARRLLWIISLANDPTALALVQGVWSGESYERELLRGLSKQLNSLGGPKRREALEAMPKDVRAAYEGLPPPPSRPDLSPILRYLVTVGLATEEHSAPADENPDLTCHELVRERIRVWMDSHVEDRCGLEEDDIRLAYAERLEALFQQLIHKDMSTGLAAGSQAVVYFAQAAAFDQLGSMASALTTSTSDPHLLSSLIPYLEAATQSAPAGQSRWRCLGCLADALRQSGRPDESLPFYAQAYALARACAEAGGEDAQDAWADVAVTLTNRAVALRDTGEGNAARQCFQESADAARTAGRPAVYVIGSELEALRIDILQGRSEEAFPEVKRRLAQVKEWWEQHQLGRPVPEAPDPESLARAYMGALDISDDAYRQLNDWTSALACTDAILETKRTINRPPVEIAASRLNRGIELVQLGRIEEARVELEYCLDVFHDNNVVLPSVIHSLAQVSALQQDLQHAIILARRALAMRERSPVPLERATSHGALAIYLDYSGIRAHAAESQLHRLAAFVYRVVLGLPQGHQASATSYARHFRRELETGTVLHIPRIADLVNDPQFTSLREWLQGRSVDLSELQDTIDQLLARVRQVALQSTDKPRDES